MVEMCGGRLAPRSNRRRMNRALLALALASLGSACAGGGSGGGGVSPGFTYNGPTTWTITGPEGGPFSNSSTVVMLDNQGSQPVSWSATSVPSFVQLDQLSGTIQPSTQIRIHADLNTAMAQTLTAGNYQGTLTFHNDSGSQADIDIACTLSIQSVGRSSQLVPATDFASQGPATGPFQPDSIVYTLTNTGSTALSWQASAPDAWVSIAPASGQLAPSGSIGVVVSINDPATSLLSVGMHQSVVEIQDAADSTVLHTRNVDLDLLPDPPSSGWTVFTPSVDTRTVYVSSSTGNDANNGLSSAAPKRTIAGGKTLLRNGFPDWLLLKCGDTWDESLNTSGEFRLNGRSLTERMLVSSYGTGARPLLRTGTGNAVDNFTQGNHIALVGLHLWAHLYTGSQGTPNAVQWLGATANFLIEDCFIEGYETNVVVMGYPEPTHRHTNVSIRRNVIADAYNTGGTNSEGIFASSTDGLLMEENVLDRNGWNDTIPGSGPTWYRRNVYIQNGCTGVALRGNILARTEGAQMRSGGSVEENLFLHLPIAVLLGGGMIPEPQGVTGTIHHNVMLDGGDLQAGSPRGWGMWLSNIAQATIDSNVIAHNVSGHAPYPVSFDVALNGRGVENAVFSNNTIYAWNGYTRFTGTAAQTVNIQLLNNKFQNEITSDPLVAHDQSGSTSGVTSANNTFDSIAAPNAWMRAGANLSLAQWKALVNDTTSVAQQVVFPDPTRSIATYHASIGGAPSLDAFMTEARNQSKSNWRVQYTARAVNDYIRAGFGL
jgi:hypothetical protein